MLQKSASLKSHYISTSKDYNGVFNARAIGKYDHLKKLKINYRNLVNSSKPKH